VKLASEEVAAREESFSKHIVVLGFGTSGKTAVRVLCEAQYPCVAVDIDPKFARSARELGAVPIVGDATQVDLLENLHLNDALAVIVAIPDHRTSAHAIALIHSLAPNLKIVARSRVHQFKEELASAGATLVIGEEELLGRRLGEESVRLVLGVEDEAVREAT
jgi:CPA2 family monovalent cation:H+ antiporter-2